MEISSKYDPSKTEDKWYKYWMDNGFFRSTPDKREPFTIVIPPPNVTGVLHMGHMLNNTIQDILIRKARMEGKNALWVPGTDHASIATEARVVNKLAGEGINKFDIGREKFLEHAWEWTHKHGGIILEQLKRLGASCDWDRTCFTMDDARYESVIKVFVDLFNKGYIYRGVRMVNWDPQAKTAVSDEEVNYKEVQSKLYYVNYKINDDNGFVTIATTRPETILGDTAVCVNPLDERFKHLKGKRVIVPLVNRVVPIIQDEYVDMEFGTGCLKITPAHDINDYEIGIKHNLDSIDIFNDDGTLNEKAEVCIGMERFAARDEVTKMLKECGLLVKIEDYTNKVGFSERTNAAIEPKLSMQWFLKMKDISLPALENVMNDNVNLIPSKFKNTYKHWMENVKDWCISRQLWWGQQIPAFYISGTNEFVVAEKVEDALSLAIEKTGNKKLQLSDLKQDDDVLDTWFSSWLWPISVFDGIRNSNNQDITYYYPTDVLVTAPDILFFWVARMIIAGYEYRNKKPFTDVYLTGMVRDKLGRKMSKSLGNSPDPLELINKYGADGVRVGMLLCSAAGNDLLFDESLTEQGRNFGNKIWNAFRLIKSWKVDESLDQPESCKKAIEWFKAMLNNSLNNLEDNYSKYRLSDALMIAYKLFWDEFSSWYLESIKPSYQQPVDKATMIATIGFFDTLLKVLHPFMPFITEELWQALEPRKKGDSIMIYLMPKSQKINQKIITNFELVKEVISGIRLIRKEKNIAQKNQLTVKVFGAGEVYCNDYKSILLKLCNLSDISFTEKKVQNAVSFRIQSTEFFVPLSENINFEEEIKKLEEELKYAEGFLKSVMMKLRNDKFVNNAPAKVIELEKKKQADAEEKIKLLKERLAGLK